MLIFSMITLTLSNYDNFLNVFSREMSFFLSIKQVQREARTFSLRVSLISKLIRCYNYEEILLVV